MKLLLGGHLNFFLPGFTRELDVRLEKPLLLNDVLAAQGIPMGEVYLVMVNDIQVDPQTKFVSDLDEVRLIPPIAGG